MMTQILNKKTKEYKSISLEKTIEAFIKTLQQQQFAEGTIRKYKSHLRKFQTFCSQNNIIDFLSDNTLSQYLNSLNHLSTYTYKYSTKVLNKFKDFSLVGTFKILYTKTSKALTSADFKNSFSTFIHLLEQSEIRGSTKYSQEKTVFNFLVYLEKNKIFSFENISTVDVSNYINFSKLANATKYNYSYTLKKFFNFTFQNSLTTFSGNEIFPKIIRNSNERILSFYSQEEISSLISVIDTHSKIGKRDYAIVIIAACLGLRAGDIVNLKIHDIDWDNKLIRITQQKNQKKLTQPFPYEVFFAILDYLKNARPTTNATNIFVSSVAPFSSLSSSALSGIVTKYFQLANVNISSRKHGIHSLRHSLANNMLHDNVSLQDISTSLGHSYISTTVMYTNIDIATLKLLSLEVDLI